MRETAVCASLSLEERAVSKHHSFGEASSSGLPSAPSMLHRCPRFRDRVRCFRASAYRCRARFVALMDVSRFSAACTACAADCRDSSVSILLPFESDSESSASDTDEQDSYRFTSSIACMGLSAAAG